MTAPIYLDYNATTPVNPRVLHAMMPYLTGRYGNASSAHAYGYDAHEGLERARGQVARLIGASPAEVIFTGGGSETNNLAIKGTAFAAIDRRPHVVTTVTEHPAVLNTLAYLRGRFGVEYSLLPVDSSGRVSPEAVEAAITRRTVLVTIMHANNEVGTVQPIETIGRITRTAGVTLHVDAAQSAGKLPIDVDSMGIDLLTIAGHKVYAPKGVGALYRRRGVHLDPLVHGSGQESGLRAGTENVAGAVALGTACEIAGADLPEEAHRLGLLRDLLHTSLLAVRPEPVLNGHPVYRLPNTLNLSFPHVTGQDLLAGTPEVAASTGSACHAALPTPSPVLTAMGLPPERALGALRLSLGRNTTEEEVERAAQAILRAYRSLIPSIHAFSG